MSNPGDGIEITYYEDWMLPQVIDMFVAQYRRDRDSEERRFRLFYEHPFQLSLGVRIVALDGRRVCGFQSYFFWPYLWQGRTLRSYQSGGSLVAPDYRGRRIFARLLDFVHSSEKRPAIDLLTGFPVDMSYGSLLRDGWENPLNLVWYVRVLNLSSVLSGTLPEGGQLPFDRKPESVAHEYPGDCFSLSKVAEFLDWRRSYRECISPLFYFHHREDGKVIRFDLKAARRGRLNCLIIGDIARDSADPGLLREGLLALVRVSRTHRSFPVLSIALNPHCHAPGVRAALLRSGFMRVKTGKPFMVKSMAPIPETGDPKRWWLMQGDIDTW